MADYYPLIARAIAGLDPNAPGESRRALYERARTALIAQLRSVQPPLSESEITRERLSLEEAVRKVESEAAQRAREASRPGGGGSRAARNTYANVPSPSPEFDRLEPSMENRGADPDAPYSYDESLEEADRYAPQPSQPPSRERSRLSQDRDREPKKRARAGTVFPFKSAIAVGVVLILVGAGILWGKSLVTTVSGLCKSSPVVEAEKDPAA